MLVNHQTCAIVSRPLGQRPLRLVHAIDLEVVDLVQRVVARVQQRRHRRADERRRRAARRDHGSRGAAPTAVSAPEMKPSAGATSVNGRARST